MGYRDISRGPQLKADYDAYQVWLAKSTADKQTAYQGSRQGTTFTYATQKIWVAPFGQNAKTLFVEVKAPAAGAADPTGTLLGLLVNQFSAAAPTGTTDIVLNATQFPIKKLAKLNVKLRVTTSTSDSTSRITGRKYKHHTTNACSMPFGKNTAGEDYAAAVKAIKAIATYAPFVGTVGNSISFVPEG